jgi:hypothetical protein
VTERAGNMPETCRQIATGADRARLLAASLGAYVRRTRTNDPELHRIVAEAEDLARDLVAECGRLIDADDGLPEGVLESVTQYAERTCTPTRTVRRWCRSGRLPATWEAGRWWIRQSSSTGHDGCRQLAASSRPWARS